MKRIRLYMSLKDYKAFYLGMSVLVSVDPEVNFRYKVSVVRRSYFDIVAEQSALLFYVRRTTLYERLVYLFRRKKYAHEIYKRNK